LAELHEIATRYVEWEITGPPEIRNGSSDGHFTPYSRTKQPIATNVDRDPIPDRRYVSYCARRKRYAQMEAQRCCIGNWRCSSLLA